MNEQPKENTWRSGILLCLARISSQDRRHETDLQIAATERRKKMECEKENRNGRKWKTLDQKSKARRFIGPRSEFVWFLLPVERESCTRGAIALAQLPVVQFSPR
ncbi:hypothetical protein Csa_013888 [Cucumis sativus]|uniref:Uncharacterized protein n=1 Tax=Cucumis sativus TaxID=3659 RepID=A0A0A0LU87_CUCSA|nr:hypothetical protein Csa_013888 [Cucumis sativus]